MALLITLILGLFFVAGALVVQFSKNSETIEHYSVAIALGAMVGIGVLDILPEIVEITSVKQFYLPIIGILIGFLILVGLDRFIPEHEEEESDYSEENMVHIGMISSFAIVLHNIIEGMAVYSLAFRSFKEGLMLMLGIGLHNIPMGMFLYSTLHTKKGWKRNLFFGATVISTFVGGIIMRALRGYLTVQFTSVLYGIALGMIIYIVALELFPYVKHNKDKLVSVTCAGIGLVIVLISGMFE